MNLFYCESFDDLRNFQMWGRVIIKNSHLTFYLTIKIEDTLSQIGGGSLPAERIKSKCVSITPKNIGKIFRGPSCGIDSVLLLIHPNVCGQEEKAIFPNRWLLDTFVPTATPHVSTPEMGIHVKTVHLSIQYGSFLPVIQWLVWRHSLSHVLSFPVAWRARLLRRLLSISPNPTCLDCFSALSLHPRLSSCFTGWLSFYCPQRATL